MTVEEYRKQKIAKYKAEQQKNIEEYGEISGLTDKEYNSMKTKQKSSVTRRYYSKGNYWNHYNEKPIKSNMKPWWK